MNVDSRKLELHFTADRDYWLSRTFLVHPEVPPHEQRPRTSPADFGWRPGVIGVCRVLLTVLQRHLENKPDALNLAICLKDYPELKALWDACKPDRSSRWAQKIFGSTNPNDFVLRKMIKAEGKAPEKQRPNETRVVRYDSSFMPPHTIQAYVDDHPLQTADQVEALMKKLKQNAQKDWFRFGRSQPVQKLPETLKTFRQTEWDEFERSKTTLFPRVGDACAKGDLLLSWAEFLPCSLETEEFMYGHHESICREVMPAPPGWRDVVEWYNDFGSKRRIRLEEECKNEKRNWKFVHMMFESDLERISSNDPEYKYCNNSVKSSCLRHLAELLRNEKMNLELGYVPKSKERAMKRPGWKKWYMSYDSVARIESNGVLSFCFTRDRTWKFREVEVVDREGAQAWLNAVKELCVFEKPKVLGLLNKLSFECTIN